MSSEAGAPGLRVLVIEDEALPAMLLEDMTLDSPHRLAATLVDLPSALAYVANNTSSFDAAILDVNLSGQPSFPLADALAGAGKAFAFSTGYGRDGLPAAWKDRPLLSKPFGAQTVVDALAQLAGAGARAES